jgi:O-methyltransferase involved in polyketide biosynthesis
MRLPHALRWIEVDYPHVIDLKEARLADEPAHCKLERVRLDLTDRTAHSRLLSDVKASAAKALVLTEGVTPYLSNDDVAKLADDLRSVEKIRFWIIDYYSPEAIRFGEKIRGRFMRNAPFRFTPHDWFAYFSQHGWRAGEMRYISEEAERLNRPIPLPFLTKASFMLKALFASPARRLAMKRYAGYVVLTRNDRARG